jgi:uncharacterized protein (TIGR02246 family)
MGSGERAIREVHATWIDAVNAGDLAHLLTLMADDVVFVNPGRAPSGRDGFSAGFSAAHQESRIRCISELEEVVVVGEVAYTLCRDSLSMTPRASGEAVELHGHRYTANSPTAAGFWPATPTRCPGWRTRVVSIVPLDLPHSHHPIGPATRLRYTTPPDGTVQ